LRVAAADGFLFAADDHEALRTVAAVAHQQIAEIEPRRKRTRPGTTEHDVALTVEERPSELWSGPAQHDIVKAIAVQVGHDPCALKPQIKRARQGSLGHRGHDRESRRRWLIQ